MANLKFDKAITALIVIDPSNDLRNTEISSSRLYGENMFPFFDVKNISIPVAVSVFPGELCQAPRSWAERTYPKLIHCNKVEKGGHLRRGTAGALLYRAPRGIQITALIGVR